MRSFASYRATLRRQLEDKIQQKLVQHNLAPESPDRDTCLQASSIAEFLYRGCREQSLCYYLTGTKCSKCKPLDPVDVGAFVRWVYGPDIWPWRGRYQWSPEPGFLVDQIKAERRAWEELVEAEEGREEGWVLVVKTRGESSSRAELRGDDDDDDDADAGNDDDLWSTIDSIPSCKTWEDEDETT